jgi:hypothetical protein
VKIRILPESRITLICANMQLLNAATNNTCGASNIESVVVDDLTPTPPESLWHSVVDKIEPSRIYIDKEPGNATLRNVAVKSSLYVVSDVFQVS